MIKKLGYLKLIYEITDKASKTYSKYKEFKSDPESLKIKDPETYETFATIESFVGNTKEFLKNNVNQTRETFESYSSSSFGLAEHDYYKVLECSPSDSNETIKNNYKRLVKDYHPDLIMGKELPQGFIDFAHSKFKEIQHAYEEIKKERRF